MQRPGAAISVLLNTAAGGLFCLAVFFLAFGGVLISGVTSLNRGVAEGEGIVISIACGAVAYLLRQLAIKVRRNPLQKIQPPPTTSSPS